MALNKYYQDELFYLRELGKEFARKNPQLAPFLEEPGNDPDVERLLEGFAFLTGRLRQKLDDELPELTHSLMTLLWPHYLRPLPSMSILQFEPLNSVVEKQPIPRGCEVESVLVEETTPCRFKTCYDVDIYPLRLEAPVPERVAEGSVLTLPFRVESYVDLSKINLDQLRLFLHGDIAYSLYLWLCRYVDTISVRAISTNSHEFTLPSSAVHPVGFREQEGLLPYPPHAFLGHRLLQEYFSLPEKFLFVDITGLDAVQNFQQAAGFELVFHFNKPLEDRIHSNLRKQHIRLYCTPIINLFPLDASPIRLDHQRVEYLVQPDGQPPEHYEIYTVDKVNGWQQGSGKRQVYPAFESFDHVLIDDVNPQTFYRLKIRPSAVQQGVDTYMTFVTADDKRLEQLPLVETVSLELTCTNRHLAGELRAGDICQPTGSTPEFVTFKNITLVTSSFSPPLETGLHWQLISNMSLNYRSIANAEALRMILSAYDFGAYDDVRTARKNKSRREGIKAIKTRSVPVLDKGVPMPCLRIHIDMLENKFAGAGDLYLFATVLNEFLAFYTSINTFHQLDVETERGEQWRWPAKQL